MFSYLTSESKDEINSCEGKVWFGNSIRLVYIYIYSIRLDYKEEWHCTTRTEFSCINLNAALPFLHYESKGIKWLFP